MLSSSLFFDLPKTSTVRDSTVSIFFLVDSCKICPHIFKCQKNHYSHQSIKCRYIFLSLLHHCQRCVVGCTLRALTPLVASSHLFWCAPEKEKFVMYDGNLNKKYLVFIISYILPSNYLSNKKKKVSSPSENKFFAGVQRCNQIYNRG